MKKKLQSLGIAFALALIASGIGVATFYSQNPQLSRLADYIAHITVLAHADRIGLKNPNYGSPNNNLAMITLDDYSLSGHTSAGLGTWPFRRGVYGTLLDRLAKAGAKTVAFDIDFLDPSPSARQDALFGKALAKVPTVLAYALNTTTTGQIGIEPVIPVLAKHVAAMGFSSSDSVGSYTSGQFPKIRTSGSGFFSDETFYSLAAAAAQTYLGHKIDFEKIPRLHGRILLLPPHYASTQAVSGRVGSEQSTAPTFIGGGQMSLADALTVPISQLRLFAKGRLVYVGATAQALGDFVITARGKMPGVYVNARLTDQMLRGIYIKTVPTWIDITLIVLLPLLLALFLMSARFGIALGVSAVTILAYAWIDMAIFVTHLLWLDFIHVVAAMILAVTFVAAYRTIVEGSQRRVVTNLFGMHVSPAVVAEILESEDPSGALSLKGKRVKSTIFYSDIRGFTAMSETMSPEDIYNQLNEYFEEMVKIIFKYGGYVDKFIGDCVMAVFSAPYQTPDDAKNAVLAAIEQQQRIAELAAKWSAQGRKVFTVGMGINTGEVVMGNLGSSSRMNYTVIGDNVNTAARLYNVAKGGQIIISETTYNEVRDLIKVTELDPVTVKGKVEPLRIFDVVVPTREAPAEATTA